MINKDYRKNKELALALNNLKLLMNNIPSTKFYQELKKDFEKNLKPSLEELEKAKLFSKKDYIKEFSKENLEEIKKKIIDFLRKINECENTTDRVRSHNDLLFGTLHRLYSLLNSFFN